MGGKSSPTVGYWYDVAFHIGLGIGPIDAFLEFRGGDLTAWSGNLVASGTITINAPNLWGGEKDQGGIQGDVDIMFGEATQQPNAYLTSTFGDQQPAWRGLATVVFKGGKYGAMNPYPQKPSFKFMRITKGWDDDNCWYPAKAPIPVSGASSVYIAELDISGNAAQPSLATPNFVVSGVQATDQIYVEHFAGMLNQAWSMWNSDSAGPKPWTNWFNVTDQNGNMRQYWSETFATADEAEAYASANPVLLYGATEYQFWIKDAPVSDNRGGWSARIRGADAPFSAMNPAHILYYARTQQAMGREPTANMNDASFTAAADWYFAQGFGLCTSWDPSAESVDDFISRIEKVAGCSMSRSPVDGLWYLDIANGVYDFNSLPILTDDDILDFSDSPKLLDTVPNSVAVTYFDPQQKRSVTASPVQAMALTDAFGTITQKTDYEEIPSGDLALRVAQRDLLASVTPARTFSLTTTRVPYAWRVNTYFRLQSPKRGIADMVCIVAEKSTGTLKSGAITLTATEDIYSLPASSFVTGEHGVDTRPSPIPVAIINQTAFEAPYTAVCAALSQADLAALPDDAGYLLTAAQAPIAGATGNYTIDVSTDGGSTYAGSATGEWCPSALIVEGDALTGTSAATTFTLASGFALTNVDTGSAALWDGEIVRVDAIDPIAGTITLGRGCADTPPAAHAANTPIWFYDGNVGADGMQYANAETIDIKLLTNTGSLQLDPSLAAALPLTFAGRQAAPYPPGNVQIGGSFAPTSLAPPFNVTWAARNRLTQADQLIDTTESAVAPDEHVWYGIRVLDSNSNVVVAQSEIDPAAGTASVNLSTAGTVTVQLWAQRDQLPSLKTWSRTFEVSSAGSNNSITATAWQDPDLTIIDGGSPGDGLPAPGG